MNLSKNVIGRFLLLAPLLLILSSYYVFNWMIFFPLANENHSIKPVIFLSHFLTGMQLWCFFYVVNSQPGTVPPYWGFFMGDSQTKKKRYCLICHLFKPQRCHHCSVCNKCVLNMDHHCPWVNNCIGFNNRKPFILLLIYTILNIYFTLVFMGPIVIRLAYQLFTEEIVQLYPGLLYIGLYCFLLLLSFILSVFTKFHLELVLKNSSTIESLESNGNRPNYSVSILVNWQQVFGKNKWYWFWPVYGQLGKPIGDGVLWPTTHQKPPEIREGYETDSARDPQLRREENVLNLDLSKKKVDEVKEQAKEDSADNSMAMLQSEKSQVLEINLR